MKIKDFEQLKPGDIVIIKKRKAIMVSDPEPLNVFGIKCMGAYFSYLDTNRKVYKNNRRVKKEVSCGHI